MDTIERAQEEQLVQDQLLLAEFSARAAAPLLATGECLYCGNTLAKGLRFCDAHCRDDYEHEKAAQQRNGR